MQKRRLRAPSPAFVISLVALMVALGGTTYAATSLPQNSVGAKQLKKNAVTSPKIKGGAVTASKLDTRGLVVPNALHATDATNATNAGHARSATSATQAGAAASAAVAGLAANADQLGGLAASSYQRRVSGTCNTAVSSIGQDGSVGCASEVVVPIDSELNDTGSGQTAQMSVGDLELKFICMSSNPELVDFVNNATSDATLDFFYFSGPSGPFDPLTGQISADGTVIAHGADWKLVPNPRAEGQFIYSIHNQEQITVNLHVVSASPLCEVTGTAAYAPLS